MAVIINEDGLYVLGSDIPNYVEGQDVELEPGQELITTPVPEGLYHPKWDGKTWVEGLSPKEIEARKTPKEIENFPTSA